jgi:hypothetical protein
MRSFIRPFLAGLLGLAIVAAGFGLSTAPASAQLVTSFGPAPGSKGVSDLVSAVSTDVGLYVKYVGARQTGTATVAVDAATGDLAFVVNGAADTTIGCPTANGTIDVSDACGDTFVEVVTIINKTANWRAVYGAVVGTDTSINTLITRSAATASGPNGVSLLKDTAVALNVTADLTPNFYSGGRTMKFFLAPGGANLLAALEANPYGGYRTWVPYATETITSSGTVAAFAILGDTVTHTGQGTTAYVLSETIRTIVSQTGAATTVNKTYDFTNFPLIGNVGERILIRQTSGTDLTVPAVGGFGVLVKETN